MDIALASASGFSKSSHSTIMFCEFYGFLPENIIQCFRILIDLID